ncbi:MAG TPA: hypothetical protein VM143_01205 [Acidimicrobiales bacterium]|nr:hypothetical protein [Acidimicrobiales bacterium]
MIARILAFVAAVAMVFGAVVYRYGMPGGPGGAPDDSGGGTQTALVVCAAELGAVCDAVPAAVVEPAVDTADRLIAARNAGDAGVAGWLAPGPWPAMVDDARTRTSRARLFASKGTGLAAAPIVAVARRGQLPAACTAEVTWKCLGDAAAQTSYGIGGDRPDTSGGLLLRAAALSGFFGNAEWATNDLEDNADAQTWIANLDARLAAAPGFGAPSLDDFLVKPGTVKVFVTVGAAAAGIGGNVSFEVRTPTPAATVAVSYTASARGGRQIDLEPVDTALRAAGWKVQRNAQTEGLPSPGVLLALQRSS